MNLGRVLFVIVFLIFAGIRAEASNLSKKVIFVNGVGVDPLEAESSRSALRNRVRNEIGIISDEEFDRGYEILYVHNTTRCLDGDAPGPDIGCLGDLYEAVFQFSAAQGLQVDEDTIWRWLLGINTPLNIYEVIVSVLSRFDPLKITDKDIQELIGSINTRTVWVPHSQGNFFVNSAYGRLAPNETLSVGVVAIATPASYVAGGGSYYTKYSDFIHTIPNALPPNTLNEGCTPLDCHDFIDSYLGGLSGVSIGNDILDLLEALAVPKPFFRISDMTSPRVFHCSVPLEDGRVLVAGGFGPNRTPLRTAEIYDPATRAFSPAGTMTIHRGRGISCTRLDDGRVLVAGGEISPFVYTNRAEIYDPESGSFSQVGHMTTPRGEGWHIFPILGGALLFGGTFQGTFGTATEIVDRFDASNDSFSQVGSLLGARRDYTAEALSDDSILLIGGVPNASQQVSPVVERYDIVANESSAPGQPNGTPRTRTWGSALIPGGNVLVVTGVGLPAEVYNPITDEFSILSGSPSFFAGDFGKAVTLTDGRVLLTGYGRTAGDGGRIAEIFDPVGGTFTALGSFAVSGACEGYAATTLVDGTVLITGGGEPPTCESAPLAEIFVPQDR